LEKRGRGKTNRGVDATEREREYSPQEETGNRKLADDFEFSSRQVEETSFHEASKSASIISR